MADLFDIANLITTVGVDAVKIKPEPGLPEKSSNEILTELFSTFDVPDGDDDNADEDDEDSDSSNNVEGENKCEHEEKEKQSSKAVTTETAPIEETDKRSGAVTKKKKVKKKHKHKNESKDKEKKNKHKKKARRHSSESTSEVENEGTKKKKKKKKSKHKNDFDSIESLDNSEPSAKRRKLNETNKDKSKGDAGLTDTFQHNTSNIVKIKKEKIDSKDKSEVQRENAKSPELPPISKILNDDTEAPEVPKLLEKSKNTGACKILIKDLKNSEVYNNAVKEVETKKREKAERMEDGEISDSDGEPNDNNRTPTLSPTPPPERLNSLRSDRKCSISPSSNKNITKKNDLRLVLKEKVKKKKFEKRSRSKSDRNSGKESNKQKDKRDSRSRSCRSRDRKTRSRSGDRGRCDRGRSRERNSNRRNRDKYSRDDDRYKSRSEDRNRNKWRGRSRSKERKERIEIDKKKLLEIARRNAINMIMKGKLPLAQQDKAIAAIKAGGKSIEELTDFCKTLSKSEAMGELSSISSEDESSSEKGFHHPFLIKDRPNSIIMNIKDAKQLPTKTLLEKTTEATNQLRLQFPVSSGQQHRKNESEWVPVSPKTNRNPKPEPKKLFIPAKELYQVAPQPLIVPPLQSTQPPTQTILPIEATVAVTPKPLMESQPVAQSIFATQPAEPVDISAIVSQRLAAMRKLSENPNDVQALNEMYKAQSGMKTWIESKQVPGQFTGSTGAKVLTPAELNSGHQAWARKKRIISSSLKFLVFISDLDQLLTAQPVSGGMGMALLQKMGWKPGEGLGKNKGGSLEPLQLEVKLDKRGLISDQDIGAAKLGKLQKPVVPVVKTLEGKHPVSLLGEYCSKRKFGAPVYELCFECGPDHKKNFLFKVKVNGMEYKPAVASPNKKLAKAEAAQICLQAIGLLQ